jgi:hypothetical protein
MDLKEIGCEETTFVRRTYINFQLPSTPTSALTMETACFSKTLISTYKSKRRYSPGDGHRRLKCRNDLKPLDIFSSNTFDLNSRVIQGRCNLTRQSLFKTNLVKSFSLVASEGFMTMFTRAHNWTLFCVTSPSTHLNTSYYTGSSMNPVEISAGMVAIKNKYNRYISFTHKLNNKST